MLDRARASLGVNAADGLGGAADALGGGIDCAIEGSTFTLNGVVSTLASRDIGGGGDFSRGMTGECSLRSLG